MLADLAALPVQAVMGACMVPSAVQVCLHPVIVTLSMASRARPIIGHSKSFG
jgi:hypothetical protein